MVTVFVTDLGWRFPRRFPLGVPWPWPFDVFVTLRSGGPVGVDELAWRKWHASPLAQPLRRK